MSYRALPDPPPIPDKPAHYRSDSEIGYHEAQYIASYEAKYGAQQAETFNDNREAYLDNGVDDGQHDPYYFQPPALDSYRPLPQPPAADAYPYDATTQPLDFTYTNDTYDQPTDDPYHFDDMRRGLPPRPLPKPPQYVDRPYTEPYDEPYIEHSPYPDSVMFHCRGRSQGR